MDTGEAFQIARIDRHEDGLIAASGRAYRDLHIGDTLEARAAQQDAPGQSTEFTVIGITTYGRNTESLGQMLTGELLLRGRDNCIPEVEMLFMGTAH